ncbi:hypothetical protein Bca101_062235 [Brassica carinata]
MYVPLPNTTSRAISGGPIYLIDHLGQASHNFNLIKKLSLFDGNVPRCLNHCLPTSDSLFMNPLYKESIPKISNFNKGYFFLKKTYRIMNVQNFWLYVFGTAFNVVTIVILLSQISKFKTHLLICVHI